MIASAGAPRVGIGLAPLGDGRRRPPPDRQDVNAVPMMPVPGSRAPASGSPGSGQPRKFFSASTDEISEASLAQGFSFPSMQALREGQLSNPIALDSGEPQLKSPRVSPVNRPSADKPPVNLVSPFFKQAVPLDSAKVALPEKSEHQQPKQLQPLGRSPSHSPGKTLQETQNQGSNAALRLRIQNLKNMSRNSGLAVRDQKNASSPERAAPKPSAHVEPAEKLSPRASITQPGHSSPPKLVTSAALQEAMRSVTDAPRARDKLRTPEYAPPHTMRRSQLEHFGSPAPFCGDLTSSARPSPTLSKRYSRHRWDNRQVSQDRERMSRHGSLPRISGIMKKKSSDHKGGSRSDLDRKKAAMYQVAQYWNECIRIAEEEKVQANLEIDKLSDELDRQDTELQELRATLDRKDRKLNDIEGLVQKVLGEKGQVAEENSVLGREIESLRVEVSDSKQHNQSLADQFQACQGQLDLANQEQQALSSRLKESEDVIDGLRKEKDAIATDSNAFAKAIDESRMQKEELERDIAAIRSDTQKELLQKEQTISELKLKVEKSEAEIHLERESSSRLRAQIENELASSQIVRQLEHKLDALLATSATAESERQKEHQENAAVISNVGDKQVLDSILAACNLSSANALTLAELEQTLQTLKDVMMARVEPAMTSLSSGQSAFGNAISQLQTSVENGLQALHDHLGQQGDENKLQGQKSQDLAEGSARLLQSCEDALNASKETCHQVELRVEAWINAERQACQDAARLHLTDVQNQLDERNEKMKVLEEKLHQAQDENAAKLDALDATISSHGEETISTVQGAANGLRDLLSGEMKAIKEMTEQMVHLNENTSAAFMAQWKESQGGMVNQGESQRLAESNGQESSEAVKDGDSVAAALKLRVQQLEEQLKAHEKLGERWRRDMKDLDAIRGKYKLLVERMPLVQAVGAKIERVMEINTSIHSTSSYLANETKWIGEQLQGATVPRTQGDDKIGAGPSKGAAAAEASPACGQDDPQFKHDDAESPVKALHKVKEVNSRRVTVHSPDSRDGSPDSPDPPSVKQEQKRRREATQVRPILKAHPSFLRGSNHQSVDFSHLLAQHMQMKTLTVAGAPPAGPAAGPAPASLTRERGYHFPTLADFESSTQSSNSEELSAGGSKHALLLQGVDSVGHDVKKRKME